MTTGADRAWGWVAHLRDGGTTPWAQWQDAGAPSARVIPGAQQLELVRQANLRGSPTPELVDRIFAASAPGRGSPDLELVGAAPESPFGPRPVDPEALRRKELIRVAAGLIADELVAAGPPDVELPRPRLWRRRYLLDGSPAQVRPLREALTAAGRPVGGRRARLLVVGGPVDVMLAGLWTEDCFDSGAPSWREWLAARAARPRIPPRIDLARIAATAQESGDRSVQVVLDAAALPRLLGLRRLPVLPPEPSARSAELARRVAGVLGMLVPAEIRPRLLRGVLAPRLADPEAGPIVVPDAHREWVARLGGRLRDGLSAGGYPVLGGHEGVLAADRPGTLPSESDVLDLALSVLLRGSAEEDGS